MSDEQVKEVKELVGVEEEPIKAEQIKKESGLKKLFSKIKHPSLYIFYMMEGLGSVGLMYGSTVWLIDNVKNIRSAGIPITLFYIGVSICVYKLAIDWIEEMAIQLRALDLEIKEEKQ